MKPEVIDTEAPPPADADEKVETKKLPTQNKASVVYNILNERPRYRSKTGRKFITIAGTATPLRRSELLKEYASKEFIERTGDTVSESAIEQAVLAISGQPLQTFDPQVRIDGTMGRVLVDLVDDDMIAVVTPEGVSIQKNESAFMRPVGTDPMKLADPSGFGIAEAQAAFKEYYDLLGLEDDGSRAATAAYIVQSMCPKGPYAMMILRGPQGSGKTTLAREIRRLVDPRAPEDVELPHNTRHLAILAEHAHLISFDNVSVINQKLSDACCRLATGSGFVTRALRTDRELASFLAARPLLFTSIGDVAVAPDLLDRALMVSLAPRARRKSELELQAQFDELRPRLLTAVLFAVHLGIKNLANVEVPGEIRMMDAARFAVAAEPAMGLPEGSVLKAFTTARNDAALVTSFDSVVMRALDLLKEENPWKGSLEDLLDALHGSSGSSRSRAIKDLPTNPRALRDRLDRVGGALRHFGVSVDLSQLHPVYRTRQVVLERADVVHKVNGTSPPAMLAS